MDLFSALEREEPKRSIPKGDAVTEIKTVAA